MNYENAINRVQGNSRFNVILLLILSLNVFNCAIDMMTVNFLVFTPNHTCINEWATTNVNKSDNISNYNINSNISSSSGSSCKDKSDIIWIESQCIADVFNNKTGKLDRKYCDKWKYDKSIMKRTLVTDFNLVCNRKDIINTLNSVFFMGITIGNLFGMLGDKLGRKKTILICCAIEVITNCILPFITTEIWLIFLLRFVWGFGYSKLYQGICLLMETVSADKRSFYGNNYWLFWVFGYMLGPGYAYAVRDWRLLKWLCNIPYLLYAFFYFIPESARWLSVVGRKKEAIKVLVYIGKGNCAKVTEETFKDIEVESDETARFIDLFKFPVNRTKLMISLLAHSTVNITYFGLSFNAGFISTNIFINVFVQGALELFTGPMAWICSSKINRTKTLLIMFVLSGVLVIGYIFVPTAKISFIIIKAVIAALGKFVITVAYIVLDMYLPEIMPTSVRNITMFIVIGIASFVTILAPWINNLDNLFTGLSNIIYGILCIASGIMIYCKLPETTGCPLPQTLLDGEKLRRGNEDTFKMKHNIKNNIEVNNDAKSAF